jgi:hypothetical protein
VSKVVEAAMNLWSVLGVSARGGLLAAAGGLVAAIVVAAAVLFRRSRAEPGGRLRLLDR